jgi:hypothetical protein
MKNEIDFPAYAVSASFAKFRKFNALFVFALIEIKITLIKLLSPAFSVSSKHTRNA